MARHGFGAIAAALKAEDTAALTRLMADDFTGAALTVPRPIRALSADVTVEHEGCRPAACPAHGTLL